MIVWSQVLTILGDFVRGYLEVLNIFDAIECIVIHHLLQQLNAMTLVGSLLP